MLEWKNWDKKKYIFSKKNYKLFVEYKGGLDKFLEGQFLMVLK